MLTFYRFIKSNHKVKMLHCECKWEYIIQEENVSHRKNVLLKLRYNEIWKMCLKKTNETIIIICFSVVIIWDFLSYMCLQINTFLRRSGCLIVLSFSFTVFSFELNIFILLKQNKPMVRSNDNFTAPLPSNLKSLALTSVFFSLSMCKYTCSLALTRLIFFFSVYSLLLDIIEVIFSKHIVRRCIEPFQFSGWMFTSKPIMFSQFVSLSFHIPIWDSKFIINFVYVSIITILKWLNKKKKKKIGMKYTYTR